MTETEKERAGEAIAQLELATGQLLSRDAQLLGLVESMREQLRALRAILQIYKPQ